MISPRSLLARSAGHRRLHSSVALAVFSTLALASAGCGSATKPTEPNLAAGATAPAPTASTPASATATTPATSTPATTPTPPANPALAKKPVVAPPKGPAPKALVTKDIVTGSGAVAKAGSNVTVQYVGVLYSNGQQFDASWDRGQPFPFALGAGQVIPGWDKGIPGMKVGGRRELIIPAALAYGAAGSPPKIGPNQPLIFVVDLLSVK